MKEKDDDNNCFFKLALWIMKNILKVFQKLTKTYVDKLRNRRKIRVKN